MKSTILQSLVCVAILITGCESQPKSGKGFSLPDGDVERGKTAYLALQCATCHKVAGIDQLEVPEGGEREASVRIGGEVSRIKTYGELVTSIINPSHRLAAGHTEELVSENGQSKMPNYNEVMTVQQLIDLVAFLQSKYKLQAFEPTEYPTYYYMGG